MTTSDSIAVEDIRTCLLCGKQGVPLYDDLRDYLFGAPGKWSHLRCPDDGHLWLNPRPVINEISKLYRNYYTHKSRKPVRSALVSIKQRVERSVIDAEFGYGAVSTSAKSHIVGKIIARMPMAHEIAGSTIMWLSARPGGKLLDIGCGNGRYLCVMKKLGWDVFGVEPDPHAANLAVSCFGNRITVGQLSDGGFGNNSFDAITAHHVIEHLFDPMDFLREAMRILKPGGKLVVTTPNIDSLGHRIFSRAWRGLEPPRHLHLFSTRLLGLCAKKTGFDIEELRSSARSAWEIWGASRLIRRALRKGNPQVDLGPALRIEGLIFQLIEHALLQITPTIGEGILLLARKPIDL